MDSLGLILAEYDHFGLLWSFWPNLAISTEYGHFGLLWPFGPIMAILFWKVSKLREKLILDTEKNQKFLDTKKKLALTQPVSFVVSKIFNFFAVSNISFSYVNSEFLFFHKLCGLVYNII